MFNPGAGRPEIFELVALAFGQGAAVYGFNRLSRASDAVMAELSIHWANYADDCPIASPNCLGEDSLECALAVGSLLGWRVKKPGEIVVANELVSWASKLRFHASCGDGGIIVTNKPRRNADATWKRSARSVLLPPCGDSESDWPLSFNKDVRSLGSLYVLNVEGSR